MGGKHLVRSKSDSAKARQHHNRQGRANRNKSKNHQANQVKNHLQENLSFCGCGFLGVYHLGVATCFHEYAPQLSIHKISGSSAGALVAAAHLCGNLQLAYATTDILRVAIDARSRTLGPFHPSFDINAIVKEALERGLPDDVHIRASGKLHISLTRFHDGQNVIVSVFDSKEDVIQALMCSCFIPLWSGLVVPKYKGIAYVDGGFSNNQLILDDKTVTVSPFAGEADICPQDVVYNVLSISLSNTSISITPHNLYRLSHALLPPPTDVLSDLWEQGFADGIRFLQRMNLISCAKCLDIRSSLLMATNESELVEQTFSYRGQRRDSVSSYDGSTLIGNNTLLEEDEESLVEDENCDGCVKRRNNALLDPLPKQFTDRIREACDNVNKSLSDWFYSHRPIKYLSYLAAPYYLPMNLSLALLMRYWQQLPSLSSELIKCVYDLKDFIVEIIKKVHERSTTSMLMSPSSLWRDDETNLKQQQTTSESSISVKFTADCRRNLTKYECCLTIVLFGQDVSTVTSECT